MVRTKKEGGLGPGVKVCQATEESGTVGQMEEEGWLWRSQFEYKTFSVEPRMASALEFLMVMRVLVRFHGGCVKVD